MTVRGNAALKNALVAKEAPKKTDAKKEKSVDNKIREAKVSGLKTLPFRNGSKTEKMVLMVMDPKGATEAEICKAIGWEGCAVTLKRAVKKAGLELKSSKNDAGKTVYTAA